MHTFPNELRPTQGIGSILLPRDLKEGVLYTGIGSGPRQCFHCGQTIEGPCLGRGTGSTLAVVYWCPECGALEVLDYKRDCIVNTYQRALQ